MKRDEFIKATDYALYVWLLKHIHQNVSNGQWIYCGLDTRSHQTYSSYD